MVGPSAASERPRPIEESTPLILYISITWIRLVHGGCSCRGRGGVPSKRHLRVEFGFFWVVSFTYNAALTARHAPFGGQILFDGQHTCVDAYTYTCPHTPLCWRARRRICADIRVLHLPRDPREYVGVLVVSPVSTILTLSAIS